MPAQLVVNQSYKVARLRVIYNQSGQGDGRVYYNEESLFRNYYFIILTLYFILYFSLLL